MSMTLAWITLIVIVTAYGGSRFSQKLAISVSTLMAVVLLSIWFFI